MGTTITNYTIVIVRPSGLFSFELRILLLGRTSRAGYQLATKPLRVPTHVITDTEKIWTYIP
jgi:hypothetical protein